MSTYLDSLTLTELRHWRDSLAYLASGAYQPTRLGRRCKRADLSRLASVTNELASRGAL